MGTNAAEVNVLVAGGGIAGLATAAAAAQRGIAVDVLEQAPEFAEIGAGIQLGPNALRMLDRLGVLEAISPHAVYPRQGLLLDAVTGECLTRLDFGTEFQQRYGYPYAVMHRSDLLDALLDACSTNPLVTLHNAKEVVSVEAPNGNPVVTCADGTAFAAAAVIGADGIWSKVREHTVGVDELVFAHHVAFRGTVPIDRVPDRAGDQTVMWWIGPKMHLMQYPIRAGGLLNQVAVVEVDHFCPDDPHSTYVDDLEYRFSNKNPFVEAGVRLISRDRRWLIYDKDPVDNWTRGRMTLVGDAAHPMLQYMAQGACQALEDAVCIAEWLARHPDDVETAFRCYQQERLPRTTRVQTWARYMAEIVHLDGVSAMLRDDLLRNRASDDFTYFDWLYSYDLALPSAAAEPSEPEVAAASTWVGNDCRGHGA
ncbi:MAG: NAD(P)-binding protein [Pseudonocardiaceae bacterium]|nr:NAD(P)-binding protein [Pseudonocardiaceae bacterium]